MKRRLVVLLGVAILSVVALARIVPAQAVTRAVLAERETESEDDEQTVDRTESLGSPVVTQPTVTIPESTAPIDSTNTSTVTPVLVTPEATSVPVETVATDVAMTTPAPVISTHFPWAWLVTRAAGIASYILLSLLSVTGMFLTTGILYRYMSPATAWSLHRAIGSVLLFSVLAHLTGIYLDSFVQLGLSDIFIPFLSAYQPILVSLGIFGFYLMLLILASSLYMMTSHAKFWRTVHFFGFPMFALIFFHGILIGTDAKQWWMLTIYYSMASLVGMAVVYRMIWKYQARKRLPPVTEQSSG